VLKNIWIGCDVEECVEYVVMNHDVDYDDVVVFEINKKSLDVDYCDFESDVGDGSSDIWSYTFIYNGKIDITDNMDTYWIDEEKWYYIKNINLDERYKTNNIKEKWEIADMRLDDTIEADVFVSDDVRDIIREINKSSHWE
jgi:hypothetical protein